MLSMNFNWKPSDGNSPVKCSNAQFGDPLPGTGKSCFCDDIGKMNPNQIKSSQELNMARGKALIAQAKAADLEKEAKAQEEVIIARRKKHLSDMEDQDKKNKAKLAALIAADKEESDKQSARNLAL